MPSITFEIFGMDGRSQIALIQGPDNLRDVAQPKRLPSCVQPLSSWSPPNPVKDYGQALLQCLNEVEADANIKRALDYITATGGTINFKLKSADWEAQTWEALWDTDNFFLLQPQRGIARMVDPNSRYVSIPALEVPVRILAVLSAAGLRNGPQWDALYRSAVQNADSATGLPVRLHLLTGEEDLADRVRDTARKDERLSVTVENIDNTGALMVSNAIKRFRPHILHCFCHGQVEANVGVLRISNIEQHRESLVNPAPPGEKPPSFVMDFSAFREIIKLANAGGWLWLTVLNACKLGGSSNNVSALAEKLAIAGVPATIGMAEEIEENDAQDFCGAFYSGLFLELENANRTLQTVDDYAPDWASLLHGPRMTISCRRVPPATHPHWTFPVMYVGAYDFRLKKSRYTSDLADSMRNGALQQLGNAPAEILESIAKVEVP